MNSLVSQGSVALHRSWSTEKDGPNDKPIEIWYNGNWVPAFFKDIKPGDFFLMLDHNLDPSMCFMSKSGVRRTLWNGIPTFSIEGLEVVQRSSIKDIEEPLQLEASKPKLGYNI